jgi:hypothetical protein
MHMVKKIINWSCEKYSKWWPSHDDDPFPNWGSRCVRNGMYKQMSIIASTSKINMESCTKYHKLHATASENTNESLKNTNHHNIGY